MSQIKAAAAKYDLVILFSAIAIVLLGLSSMFSFTGDNGLFYRQIIWICVSVIIYIFAANIDFGFLKRTSVVVSAYILSLFFLLIVFAMPAVNGAQSWFLLGALAIQPAEPIKLVIILVLAKYFSRRHIAIANIRHIIVSGIYVFIPFFLILLQPDFGTAVIYAAIWFLMVLISGINKKHLILVLSIAALAAGSLWMFGLAPYQKDRIISFLHPTTDIQGIGYNAYQSMVAIGSGEMFGKGIGYGTQSKLRFLPEYQTDFIFASFSEEWGFVGVLLLMLLYFILISRIVSIAWRARSNFESLFAMGVASMFVVHIVINSGMNLGLLPVTGTTIPFMSYGGSHLFTSFLALGILASFGRNTGSVHRDDV